MPSCGTRPSRPAKTNATLRWRRMQVSLPRGDSHSGWDQVALAALPFALALESLLSPSLATVARLATWKKPQGQGSGWIVWVGYWPGLGAASVFRLGLPCRPSKKDFSGKDKDLRDVCEIAHELRSFWRGHASKLVAMRFSGQLDEQEPGARVLCIEERTVARFAAFPAPVSLPLHKCFVLAGGQVNRSAGTVPQEREEALRIGLPMCLWIPARWPGSEHECLHCSGCGHSS